MERINFEFALEPDTFKKLEELSDSGGYEFTAEYLEALIIKTHKDEKETIVFLKEEAEKLKDKYQPDDHHDVREMEAQLKSEEENK